MASGALLGAHAPLRSVLPPTGRLDVDQHNRSDGEWVAADVDFRGPDWINQFTSAVLQTGVAEVKGNWDAPRYLCSARLNGRDLPRVRKLAAWRWKTADGELVAPVDPPALASIAARHPVALLGESLNHELFVSLVGLLASQQPRATSLPAGWQATKRDGKPSSNITASVGDLEMEVALGNGGRLAQLDATLLKLNESTSLHSAFGPSQAEAMHSLLARAAKSGFRVLVMSSLMMRSTTNCKLEGTKVSKETLASDGAMAAAIGGFFRSASPTFDLLVYISFDPNHAGCDRYTEPRPHSLRPSIHELQEKDLFDYKRFCWGQVRERSEHFAHVLHAHLPRERFALIDARRLTDTRPEAHSLRIPSLPDRFSDCMHYCLPGGPIETWADLLQAVLQQRLPVPQELRMGQRERAPRVA